MSDLVRISDTPSRMREAMQATGKSQADLADETGLSRSSVSRYLAGTMEPKSKAIHALAAALNVQEMWLWGYDVPKERTDEQKKNDQLAKLTVRMYRDPAFAEAISILSEMSQEELNSWLMLLRR